MPAKNQFQLFSGPEDEPYVIQKFSIYRSSAGSGKTFTLAKDYLKILLRDPAEYKHILAITFTNKATEEMKTRILEELSGIARGEESDMRKDIEAEFEESGMGGINKVITRRASLALSNILHDYSRFEISTIDHFFSRVVRALALELNLPLRYDVDVDSEKALKEAIRMVYEELGENVELRKWLEKYAFDKIEDSKGWKIDREIEQLGMELFKEKVQEAIASIERHDIEELKNFVGQLRKTIRDFNSTLKAYFKEVLDTISQHGYVTGDFVRHTASFFETRLKNEDFAPTPTIEALGRGEKNWYKKSGDRQEELQAFASEYLDPILRKYLEYYELNAADYISAQALLRHIYTYGLLGILNQKLKKYKHDNNLLLISDTNVILKEVIRDQDAPFIYEKLGGRYKYILIDEFQDTSRYQWKNLLPLVINSISNNHQGLIVGDVKQAIYRWRGGDLKLLLEDVEEDLRQYEPHIERKELKYNWRSRENIVSFNNAFFELASEVLNTNPAFPAGKNYIRDAYRGVGQIPRKEPGGYVNVRFFQGGISEYREQSRIATLALITELIQKGYGYKDILILVDKRTLASEMALSLTTAGIPVVTDSSLKLTSSRVINLMIHIFSWIANPRDEYAKANIFFLYSRIKEHTPMYAGPDGSDEQLSELLPEAFMRAVPVLRSKPVHEIVEEVIMLLELQNNTDLFIQRFLDICLEQAIQGNHDIQSFLAWWYDIAGRQEKSSELSLVVPADSDAVQVMTIHKAKGLEKSVVIIPFSDYWLTPRRSTFWTGSLRKPYAQYGALPLDHSPRLAKSHFSEAYRQELMEESLERFNQTYVAFTRAREQLYIFSQEASLKDDGGEYNQVNKLLQYVLSNERFSLKDYLDTGSHSFEFGTSEPGRKETDKASTAIIGQFESVRFSDKVVLREDSKRFFTLLDTEAATRIREGLFAHAVLEKIRDPEEIRETVLRMKEEGYADPEMMEKVIDHLEALFRDPVFKSFFDQGWEVFTERSIFYEGQEYRPDRVLVKAEEAIIVDYKRDTGEGKYLKQVERYASLLERMGYKKVKKYLVYVENLKVEEV